MTPEEIARSYEQETGNVIIETFRERKLDLAQIPAVLVHSHSPFAWGTDPFNAVHSAVVLEEYAFMDFHAMQLAPGLGAIQQEFLDKHYLRKHAPGPTTAGADGGVRPENRPFAGNFEGDRRMRHGVSLRGILHSKCQTDGAGACASAPSKNWGIPGFRISGGR